MNNLVNRLLPKIADSFIFEIVEKADGKGVYKVEAKDGKIVVSGDCKISQAVGLYAYLKKYCGVNYSWCGNTSIDIVKAPLPFEDMYEIIEQKKRAYMNYCTFGYSAAFWDWERWEREIDFMALNGINMPLSIVGTEAVWYDLLTEMGITKDDALDFISGPAYLPWQYMTNLDSYVSMVDPKYIKKRMELGKKIIEREKELGMTPVLHGFSGHVPKFFTGAFKKARYYKSPQWCKFPAVFLLDPLEELFKKIGTAYLTKQRELFGECKYFACDPFHESMPSIPGDKYLNNVGKAITELYTSFDSEAVWVMQSWSLREQIVKAVPKDKLLIFDINSEGYKKHDGFWGYEFISGIIHNFGGRNSLHGSIDELAANKYEEIKELYPNVNGTGLFMEGINQNPLYYDLAFEMLTHKGKIDLEPWLEDYAYRRYGVKNEAAAECVKKLWESCYSPACTGRETASIVCARPTTNVRHAGIKDVFEMRYNNYTLFEAAKLLIEAEGINNEGYRYDICDFLRQALSNLAKKYYTDAIVSYKKREVSVFEYNCNTFLDILSDIDRLLLTYDELSLPHYLKQANKAALLDADRQNFELNLLLLVTLWGPASDTELYDYAWREWGDLIKTYYIPRWNIFFKMLAKEFGKKKDVDLTTKKQSCDRDDYLGTPFYKELAKYERGWLSKYAPVDLSEGKEETVAVAKELLQKYLTYFKSST